MVRDVYSRFFEGRWDMTKRGSDFVFTMTPKTESDIRNKTVDQALLTIDNRINAYGVAEPVIQRQGFGDSDRLVLQLPGVDDPERVKKLIKETAFLEFRLVAANGGGMADTRQELIQRFGSTLPPNVEILPGDRQDATGKVIGEGFYALEKNSVVSGRDLKHADVGKGEFGEPVVQFRLSYEKGQLFGDITGSNIGRQLAIVLDGRVISAPAIRAKIYDQGIIEGGFSREEATDLSTSLRSGALPAGITTLEERTVGPALGQDSIDQSLFAGLLGGALVVVIMLVVYMLSGVNAVVVLALNVVLVFGVLASFGATLTLPGIAGIILTVGMAVDANVLIFERIREELRAGRTVKAAVQTGFSKAMSSILDANITTVIAGVFLFQFGTGPIRGFAVTLITGIFCSVFTAVFVSRWLFDLWMSRKGRLEKISI